MASHQSHIFASRFFAIDSLFQNQMQLEAERPGPLLHPPATCGRRHCQVCRLLL